MPDFIHYSLFINHFSMFSLLSQATETAQSSLLSGWDSGLVTGGTAAAVLAALWVFIKVVRTVVGILFMLCVVFLVLKVCFDIDLTSWLLPLLENCFH